jgi:hypothetical protein
MPAVAYTPNSCDLFSNFLTHSYFLLLEHYNSYHPPGDDEAILLYTPFVQSIKSFIFILQTSKNTINSLDEQIFKHYLPYTHMSKSQILKYMYKEYPEGCCALRLSKSHLTLKRARKCYLKAVAVYKKQHNYTQIAACNIAFIKLYFCIIYHHFPDFSELPELLKASDATSFCLQIYSYHLRYLSYTHQKRP